MTRTSKAVSFEQSFESARESVHEFERQIVTGFSLRESVPCALDTKEIPIQLLRQRVCLGSVC